MNWILGYLLIGTCVQLAIMALRVVLGKAQPGLREVKGESVKVRLAFAGTIIFMACINIIVWPITIACEVYSTIKGW